MTMIANSFRKLNQMEEFDRPANRRTQMSASRTRFWLRSAPAGARAVKAVTVKLDQQQLETVELMYDIVDQQQITQWEAENTAANMVRHRPR